MSTPEKIADAVAFESRYGIDESVRRLAGALGRQGVVSFRREWLSGEVTAGRVVLRHSRKFRNPRLQGLSFFGSFREVAHGSVLEGRFARVALMAGLARFFLGFSIFWTLLAVIAAVVNIGKDWIAMLFPLFGLVFVAVGLGMVRMFRDRDASDITYISDVVRGSFA